MDQPSENKKASEIFLSFQYNQPKSFATLANPSLLAGNLITMADSHHHQQSVPTPENLRDNMERRSSLWSDDDTTIPMTTRPHFPHTDLIHWELLNQSGSSDSDCSHLLLVSPLQEMSHNLPAKKNADSRTESMCSLEGELSTQFGTTDKEGNSIFVSVLYGMINAIIILPILCSFASIIYRDDAFASFIPVLVKLTLVSGVVVRDTKDCVLSVHDSSVVVVVPNFFLTQITAILSFPPPRTTNKASALFLHLFFHAVCGRTSTGCWFDLSIQHGH